MVSLRALFRDAAARFDHATVAIVYAHSFDRALLARHYLKQRTETLSGYADVVDLLGAQPVFFNLDQFLETAANPSRYQSIDFVINVPGGALTLDDLLLPPAVAAKIAKPIFPASAQSVAIGQNKPIATRVAVTLGWPAPQITEATDARPEGEYIVKPRSAGDSFGLARLDGTELRQKNIAQEYFAQEFVRGYDLTTYVMTDPLTGRHLMLESSMTIPHEQSNTGWYWNFERKNAASGRGLDRFQESDHKREPRKTSSAFDAACAALCKHLNVTTLARIDTRLSRYFGPDEIVDLDSALFLEINVLPSITPSGSWHAHINSYLEARDLAKTDVHAIYEKLPPMQAAMLFLLLSWAAQMPVRPVTGVDQLK
jgi:hypothetical protein